MNPASSPHPHPLPPSGGPSARTPAGPPPPSLGEGGPSRQSPGRGIAIPVVLSVISLCLVVVTAVASAGMSSLFYCNVDHDSKQSVYAAEAGVAYAIRQIIAGTAGWNGYTDVAYGSDSHFSVQVIKGPSSGPGLPTVPAGDAYLLATGTTRGKYPRRVGVLIVGAAAGSISAFPYAVAAHTDIDMQGGGGVGGAMKASADLHLQGGIKVTPVNGDSRMIAGTDLKIGNGIKRDDSQDMRSGGPITIGPTLQSPDPVNFIFPNDTSVASHPFIADGRFTNALNTGEVGEILPNPDPTKLLGLTSDGVGGYQLDPLNPGLYLIDASRTDVVQHAGTTIPGTLSLAGKIHFFPNGVTLNGNVQGSGTIVSGGGHDIDVSHVSGAVNLLALSWPNSPGQGSINIASNTQLQGLLLAHKSITTQGNFSLVGSMIAYSDSVVSQGHRDITYDGSGYLLPGLETWATPGPSSPPGPGTGTGIPPGQPVRIISWQRL